MTQYIQMLLQRMENYRALAILATNMKSALDSAFIRRLRFPVNFPLPDQKAREEIWKLSFPKAMPTEGLVYKTSAYMIDRETGKVTFNDSENGAVPLSGKSIVAQYNGDGKAKNARTASFEITLKKGRKTRLNRKKAKRPP